MAHQITWYMARRILYAQVMSEMLSLDEIDTLSRQLPDYIAQNEQQSVHLVIDVSRVDQIQPMLLALGKLFTLIHDRRMGHAVLIGDPGLGRLVSALLNSPRFANFTSLEEGVFYLQDVDGSLLLPAGAQVYSQPA